MNQNIAALNAKIAIVEAAFKANAKAIDAWYKSDRSAPAPEYISREEATVVHGEVSVYISAPAQNARSRAPRRNFMISGKRSNEDKVVMFLLAQ